MKSNFDSSLEHVLIHEGGYVDHPQDPGGATNKGVTLAVFQSFYGASMGKDDLKQITDEQLGHIYKTGYWDKCRCDDLGAGIDYVVFDQAVNSGPGRSAKWLQGVIGVTVDGGIGPQTLAAAKARDGGEVIKGMCTERIAFLKRIKNGELWETFGRGWQARVDGVRKDGLTIASGGEAKPTIPETPATTSVEYDVVRRGSSGEWVKRLQQALDVGADGIFGPGTEVALKEFQQDNGLTADGVAGRNTYKALGLIA